MTSHKFSFVNCVAFYNAGLVVQQPLRYLLNLDNVPLTAGSTSGTADDMFGPKENCLVGRLSWWLYLLPFDWSVSRDVQSLCSQKFRHQHGHSTGDFWHSWLVRSMPPQASCMVQPKRLAFLPPIHYKSGSWVWSLLPISSVHVLVT